MKYLTIVVLFGILIAVSGVVLASTDMPAPVKTAGQTTDNSVNYLIWTVVAAMMGVSFAAGLCSVAQGGAVKSAIESIARQPETAAKIQLILMIGLAFIESLVLYTLFVSIILLFVNPFIKYIF